jgi:hypothetical protein
MRRITFAVVTSALLLAFAPAGALARSHHHGKKHSRGAHHARIRRFGDMSPTAPTTTGSPAPAGTIVKFDTATNMLTVQFNDGNMVTGLVTNDTEIECTSSSQSTDSGSDDQSEDQSQTSGSGETSDSDDQGEDQGQTGGSSQTTSSEDQSDDQGDDGGSSSSCGTSSLQTGAMVLGAEVRFGASTTWEKIQLA